MYQFPVRRISIPRTESSLSEHRRRLVKQLRRMRFGQIENLQIRGGEPLIDDTTRIVLKVKFGSERSERKSLAEDCYLKDQVVEMLQTISEIGDGTVRLLTCQDGLPFSMEVECGPETQWGDDV